MYESRTQRPLSAAAFRGRLARHVAVAAGLVVISLAAGMAGFVVLEGSSWPDAFHHAAVGLGGMEPPSHPHTAGGKLFAGAYALYAGIVFIATIGVVLAPLVHRLLHKSHWDDRG